MIFAVLFAGIMIIGSTMPAWGAQLEATINPDSETSPFKISYQKTVFIEYLDGGALFEHLDGKEWTLKDSLDSSHPAVQSIINKLNEKIRSDGSQVGVSDLTVSYDFYLKARPLKTSVDFTVVFEGLLNNYVIVRDSQKTLVDLGWRAMSIEGPVLVDGMEINIPLNIIRDQEPDVYSVFAGTEAESILAKPIINADFILEQPFANWHFLFDPTGINVDAGTYGISDEIAGFVVSRWTMGESSLREGRQVERTFEATINADQIYSVQSVQSADHATIAAIGFGTRDILDGIEIVGLTPSAPEGYQAPGGEFSVSIIYGMAGLAAVAGIGFFIFSNRSLKNEKQGQQGIDPTHLVGYQTSGSSGGYQTNRGEAQLRDDTDYNQTRNVYENSAPQTAPTSDAACGCAASAEMGSECDCEMQGSCLCDATCQCG
ncbi:MAG: hypothetical protein D9C04_04415, partial [Nitrosopumilus sp. B06]